jgi:hypothetical protein
MPEMDIDGLLGILSVNGTQDYQWYTECLSIDRSSNTDEIIIKYYTRYLYDKYDEGLEKHFTIRIKNEYVYIEFDDFDMEYDNGFVRYGKIQITLCKFFDNPLSMPDILKQFINTRYSYTKMNLGKIIFDALTKVYINKSVVFEYQNPNQFLNIT